MRLRDGTVLMHITRTPYDPRKAHEYYLRTRHLKGRKTGRREAPKASSNRPSTYTVQLPSGKTTQLTEKELVRQKAYVAKRVQEIKNRLDDLRSQMTKALSEAKQKAAKKNRDAKKAPTASEKSKAARESKQYREKHKTKLATQRKATAKKEAPKSESKSDPVAELEHKITQVKGRLTAVVARQRALAGATKKR